MLFLLLYPYADKFSVLHVLRYPTFRMACAGLFALLLGMLAGPRLIRSLKEQQHGQSNVREDTPDTHKKKAGTPTMGGALILLCSAGGTLLFADLRNRFIWGALIVMLGYG